jgi:hypothetical protein
MQPYGEESAPAHMKGRRLLKKHERNITGLAVDASHKSASHTEIRERALAT